MGIQPFIVEGPSVRFEYKVTLSVLSSPPDPISCFLCLGLWVPKLVSIVSCHAQVFWPFGNWDNIDLWGMVMLFVYVLLFFILIFPLTFATKFHITFNSKAVRRFYKVEAGQSCHVEGSPQGEPHSEHMLWRWQWRHQTLVP